MADLYFECGLFAFNILILAIHCFGTYLMNKLYINGHDCTRLMYLINLSVLESLKNVISILCFPIIDIFDIKGESESIIELVQMFVGTLGDCLNVIHYFLIAYIAVDRFLEVWLSIKYPVYWDQKKGKYLLIATWCIPLVVFIGLFIAEEIMHVDLILPYLVYIYATLDIVLVLVFVCTNGYIYHLYYTRKNDDPAQLLSISNRTSKKSIFNVLRKTTFFISSLLIANYFLLRVVPDFVYLIIGVIPDNRDYTLFMAFMLVVTLSDFIDACIYVFTVRSVKDITKRKLLQLGRYLFGNLFNSTKPYCIAKHQGEQVTIIMERSLCDNNSVTEV